MTKKILIICIRAQKLRKYKETELVLYSQFAFGYLMSSTATKI